MQLDQIKAAVDAGARVHWANDLYFVIKDSLGQYLIKCPSTGGCWGLTHADGVTVNGKPEEFYLGDKARRGFEPGMAVRDMFAACHVRWAHKPASDETVDDSLTLTVDGQDVGEIQITQFGIFCANIWTSPARDEMEHGHTTAMLAIAACEAVALLRKYNWL